MFQSYDEGFNAGYEKAAKEISKLEKEINRLKEGKFTKEEFNNLCHQSDKPMGAREFANGCLEYQCKLFGYSPDKDLINFYCGLSQRLREQIEEARVIIEGFVNRTNINVKKEFKNYRKAKQFLLDIS